MRGTSLPETDTPFIVFDGCQCLQYLLYDVPILTISPSMSKKHRTTFFDGVEGKSGTKCNPRDENGQCMYPKSFRPRSPVSGTGP